MPVEELSLRILFIVAIALFPIIKIIFGAILSYKTPSLNWLFGYRSSQSMKNEEAWHYANKTTGKIWLITAPIELIILLTFSLLFNNLTAYIIMMFVPLVTIFIMIVYIEIKLKIMNKDLK